MHNVTKTAKTLTFTTSKGLNNNGGNAVAMLAHLRSGAGAMKDRRQGRGGAKRNLRLQNHD